MERRPVEAPNRAFNADAPPERLQKVLAHAGVGSRRSCEDYILQGRVTINGEIVRELGTKVVAGRDKVAVDGQAIHDERPAYIAVNKPKGYVSTNNDPSGRPRVVDLIPDIPQRVYTVGRLDEMSTGLMLLTNDGEMANRLAHPKFGVEKIYRAVVAGVPSPEVLQKLIDGVWLAEGKVRAKRARPIAQRGDSTVMELVLAEGKNREVRRMFAKFGHKVMTLTRVAVGPITLKGLKPGGWRFLSNDEVNLLKRVAAGLPVPTGRYGSERPAPRPSRGPLAPNRPAGIAARREASERRDGGPRDYPSGDRRPGRPDSGRLERREDRGDRPNQGPPRPRLANFDQDRGASPRPQGSGPRRDGAPSSGRPNRPPAPAPRRPIRDEPPPRRIIGMDNREENSAPQRRPAPRPAPGRPLGPRRPLPLRKRRPGSDSEE